MRKPPQRRPSEPRLTPSEVGQHLAQRGSLKGLPYGPGARQREALEAFYGIAPLASPKAE